MDYSQILMSGWGLNILMFLANFLLALNMIKFTDTITMNKEHQILGDLKIEIDKYYPNRGYETLISYFIPFAVFYRVLWRIVEMFMFFRRNGNVTVFDFMVYKYEKDISNAKENLSS
mgnify:CR=1 FL=1|jgi:hypothetical protein